MLYMQTDDGIVEIMLLYKRLTTAVCVSYRKMQQKVLFDSNSVIKVCTCLYCTSIIRLK